MKASPDREERKSSQDSMEEEFGLERIMAYTVSAIGLCLILLNLIAPP